MSEQQQRERPIGYWLKRADQLLTEGIDKLQRANGLTRLEWQALNVIVQGGREGGEVSGEEIAATLHAFTTASQVEGVLENLAKRGEISPLQNGYQLTDAGRELYNRAGALQQEFRQQSMAGISEAEYMTTMRTLRQLVENLERGMIAL
ncbi:MAG: MarR family winged helix-turn-helix transcriptional regulator [Candidatus Kapaibacterium sp.]